MARKMTPDPLCIPQRTIKEFLTRSFTDMVDIVSTGGCWIQSDIVEKNFPLVPKRETPKRLFTAQPGPYDEFDELLESITSQGLQLGTVDHMWLVAAHLPGLQLEHYVAAAGTMWHKTSKESYIPHLRARGKERQAYIRYTGLGWDDRWVFLVYE